MELETPLVDEKLMAWGHKLVLLPGGVSESELCKEVSDCELLLMCYTPVTAKVIEAAPQLKGIVKFGVGIDAIDIPAAHAAGIKVVNIPEYAEETVAEGAFAILIALAKRMPALWNEMQSNSWVWPKKEWMGLDIAGKTLGIVGCGKIGSSLARMVGAGFRARVIGYDPNKSRDEMAIKGIEKYDNLTEMLGECDFISLHAVLNKETKHLIGAGELAAMKPTALLINTARGALVDEIALSRLLKKNKLPVLASMSILKNPSIKRTTPSKGSTRWRTSFSFPTSLSTPPRRCNDWKRRPLNDALKLLKTER